MYSKHAFGQERALEENEHERMEKRGTLSLKICLQAWGSTAASLATSVSVEDVAEGAEMFHSVLRINPTNVSFHLVFSAYCPLI